MRLLTQTMWSYLSPSMARRNECTLPTSADVEMSENDGVHGSRDNSSIPNGDILSADPDEKRDPTEDREMNDAAVNSNTTTISAEIDKPLKILFLSSDTGGGHRASAESLAKQFQLQFPGSTYELMDVMKEDGIYPYNKLVEAYKHLSAHPKQWQIVFGISNTRAYEMLADAHLKIMCERAMRRRIKSYNPDVVVSVHPLMTNVPVKSCRKISDEVGKYLPMFTVVTDLGSAHCLWFANGVDRMFIASEQIRKLAKSRGKVPDEKLIQSGLPIRHDFALQAEQQGDRMSPSGKEYQRSVRSELKLQPYVTTILVMGGGEGVGSLSNIVNALYIEFHLKGVDAQIVVVCGRNLTLKKDLEDRNWSEIVQKHNAGERNPECFIQLGPALPSNGCLENTMASQFKRMLSYNAPSNFTPVAIPAPASLPSNSDVDDDEGRSMASSDDERVEDKKLPSSSPAFGGRVSVFGLGFVTNIAEYMVAADVLISKAGPGTIAEAAALGLPVMLTSYLPGQEEGNVDFVVENDFGRFISDADPFGIAEEVCRWASSSTDLQRMSQAAKKVGRPNAAAEIVQTIGQRTLYWRKLNADSEVCLKDKDKDANAK